MGPIVLAVCREVAVIAARTATNSAINGARRFMQLPEAERKRIAEATLKALFPQTVGEWYRMQLPGIGYYFTIRQVIRGVQAYQTEIRAAAQRIAADQAAQ